MRFPRVGTSRLINHLMWVETGGASEANAHRGKYWLSFEDLNFAANAEIYPPRVDWANQASP